MLPRTPNGRIPDDSDCKNSISYMAFASCLLLLVIYMGFCTIQITGRVHLVIVDQHSPILFRTSDKFLSIALDSSVIASGFKNFNTSNPKLVKMIHNLSPAYLRVGGNLADRLIFTSDNYTSLKTSSILEPDGSDCSYTNQFCEFSDKPFFTMNEHEWLTLYELTKKTNLDMVFDLNVLRRLPNDSWNYQNVEELIAFSDKNDFNINWQLGNEPNAFLHQFNQTLNASQLAKDFKKLKEILLKYSRYSKSLLIGPDTTRPDIEHTESMKYIATFLKNVGGVLDVISWHQYYFNGRTAEGRDFLNPKIFDVLQWQIEIIKEIRKLANLTNKDMWLGETSSAWGGGSPRFSNKFIACFIWLDKLGLSSKLGVNVVARQSIFDGYYALIGDDYMPNPDYWISILYKKLVGPEVLSCFNVVSKRVRFYCHCTKTDDGHADFSSVTVYGMNMQDVSVKIRIEGLLNMHEEQISTQKILSYTLTSKNPVLLSRDVCLNGEILQLTEDGEVPVLNPRIVDAMPYVVMPPFSVVFWVVPTKTNVCNKRD